MKKQMLLAAALTSAGAVSAYAGTIDVSFSTFVTSSAIDAVEAGNNSTIAFNFTGTQFVGSVFYDNQLYSTNLSGGGLADFGVPLGTGTAAGVQSSGSVEEVAVGASLGQSGFASGDIYVGSGADGDIFHYTANGSSQSLFATLPSGAGDVRQIFFDPGTSFGGNMLVATTSGNIYKITSGGAISLVASIGENSEGMDIASSAWGPYAGDLLVGSEDSGTVRLVSPTGTVTVLGSVGEFPGVETVSVVPLNLNAADPLQGFYVANYPNNIQFATASNFMSLLGDAIITDEFGGNTMWAVSYNGTGFTVAPFTFTGNSISQFEDGEFVTSQRETDIGNSTPEPASLLLLGPAMLGLAVGHIRKRRIALGRDLPPLQR
jgi:hypothetical protein